MRWSERQVRMLAEMGIRLPPDSRSAGGPVAPVARTDSTPARGPHAGPLGRTDSTPQPPAERGPHAVPLGRTDSTPQPPAERGASEARASQDKSAVASMDWVALRDAVA